MLLGMTFKAQNNPVSNPATTPEDPDYYYMEE